MGAARGQNWKILGIDDYWWELFGDARRCLECDKFQFFSRYMTMDELCFSFRNPIGSHSRGLRGYDEPNPKRGKTQKSTGTVIALIFG